MKYTAPELSAEELVRVAQNPNTPAETLTELAQSPHASIRAEIAKHPNTTADTLEKIATDASTAALSKLTAMLDEYEKAIYNMREYSVRRNQPFENNALLQANIQRFISAYNVAHVIFDYESDKYDWIFKATGYVKPVKQAAQKATPSSALKAAMSSHPTATRSRNHSKQQKSWKLS